MAETCNLIHRHLPDGESLLCERLYRTMVDRDESSPPILPPLVRADLVVAASEARRKGKDEDIGPYVRFIIEVKRADAALKLIREDLKRLHRALELSCGQFRCFLFLVREAGWRAAKGFATHEDESSTRERPIEGCGGCYRVRTTRKAAPKFNKSSRGKAHYASLIEVFRESGRNDKRRRTKPP